ncbi:hypothetical protein [Streptomyces sp. NPDC058872]
MTAPLPVRPHGHDRGPDPSVSGPFDPARFRALPYVLGTGATG